jgi:hypothetical protein
LLFKLSEFNSLDDLLNPQLEELDLPCLDSLVVEHKVVVDGILTLLTLDDTTFEKAFGTGTRPNQFRSDLATVSAVDDNSLVAVIIGEYLIRATIEHHAILI